MHRWLPLLAVLGLTAAPQARAAGSRPVDFTREVRPILANHCFACHGPDARARKARLRLDTADGATRELPSGSRAVVPGKPDASELVRRLTTDDAAHVMPPRKTGKRPTAAEVAMLRRWVEQGAKYTRHWAYVPPARPALPRVADPYWPVNAIDYYTLARMEAEGLRPSPTADRYALLRRVTLDLTGLPPTPAEADRFAADPRPDAYERVVDELLARPGYGERWVAVWLDLARYGDSVGYAHDPARTIWRWRDWVIQALNANLPYDRFTAEMLAGDLLPGATSAQRVATGFHRNTPTNTEGGSNAEEYHHATVVDRVNTTMEVWMGTTLACAQCHDHKYDPFTQKDYYRLFAVFNNTADFNSETPDIGVARVGREAEYAAVAARLAEARRKLDTATRTVDVRAAAWKKAADRKRLPKDVAEALAVPAAKRSPAQKERLTAYQRSQAPEWVAADAAVKALTAEQDRVGTTTLVMQEGPARPTYVALRGDFRNKGERVQPGPPAALHPAPAGARFDRLALARWLVDPQNPLTARVAVNRLWQELFGVGIVETSEEFGTQGEPPSHPELLDWLATEYVRRGWDTKQMVRLIVTSATYRQSSDVTAERARHDPANRLLARGPRVRLSAESLRDQALAAAGLLSPKEYGPPVQPPQPRTGLNAAFSSSTDWETSGGADCHRRAVYTRWRRNLPYPSMLAFDVPERSVCSMRRIRTNTPLQALVTLNDPVYVEAAQALARRVLAEAGPDPRERARHGFRLVLTRPPAEAEVARLVALFERARAALASDPAKARALATKPLGPVPAGVNELDAAAWTVVGNVLLNLDETLAKR